MRRIMGSDRRDRVMAERYRPYSYQSNSTALRYVGAALAIWVALALGLAWNDRSNASLYQEWDAQGLTAIPPSVASLTPQELDEIFDYSEKEGLACTSIADINSGSPDCDVATRRSREFADSQNMALFLFVGMIFTTLVVAFPFSNFINRASRNLLTLKSAGQKHSPEWAVLWFFIPIMNAVRPVQVVRELFRASDPGVSIEDQRDWQQRGRTPAVLYLWWPMFVASLFFNPVVVTRIWAGDRLNISDLIRTSNMLFWSDFLLALTGLALFLTLWQLHNLQEARHAKVGDIVVTRPMPNNPFAGEMSSGQEANEPSEGDNR